MSIATQSGSRQKQEGLLDLVIHRLLVNSKTVLIEKEQKLDYREFNIRELRK